MSKVAKETPYTYTDIISCQGLPFTATGNSNVKKPTNAEVASNINSELARKIQEIIGIYISLEEYFMIESVQKV